MTVSSNPPIHWAYRHEQTLLQNGINSSSNCEKTYKSKICYATVIQEKRNIFIAKEKTVHSLSSFRSEQNVQIT